MNEGNIQRTQSPEESSQSWTGNFLRIREWNWLPGKGTDEYPEILFISESYQAVRTPLPLFCKFKHEGGGGKPGLSNPYSQTALSAAAPGAGRGAGKLSGASEAHLLQAWIIFWKSLEAIWINMRNRCFRNCTAGI